MNSVTKAFLSIILSISLLMGSTSALADKVVLEHNGVSGIWFDEATATRMLEDLTEFSIIKYRKVPELENKARLLELNIESYKLEVEVTEKISGKWESALNKSEKLREEENKRFQEELAKKDKWYRSPAFMFVIGIFTGGLLSVGLAFGLEGAK